MTKFTDLGLSQPLINALAAKGYDTPTPIQAKAIPLVLEGRDLLGIAQTGTGKTAAFVLPSLDRLVRHSTARPQPGRARMLVLTPTRELAAQIAVAARTYAQGQHLSVGVIYGGVPVPRSIREVSRGLDLLVATPGRLLDLVDQGVLNLSGLEILVLDEADQMLDLGFIHALKRIVRLIPAKRQTLFFSATMPKQIRQLADAYLTSPAEVAVTPVATTAERVSQAVTFVNQPEKTALLIRKIGEYDIERALVFSRTKHGADKIVRVLEGAGIPSNAIHGNKSQGQRERALEDFRSGRVPILIATDIAARGIDIPGVSHVFNYDLPDVPEQYVHRIGRTARAGADGEALAFCSPEERINLRDIEKLVRMKLEVESLPHGFMETVAQVKKIRPAPKKSDARPSRERELRRPTAVTEIKADRRADNRQRANRYDRAQSGNRNPHRGEGRTEGQPGQRFPARGEGRAEGQPGQRQGHRPGQRPGGPKPSRPNFRRGRRGGGGGGGSGQRAQG